MKLLALAAALAVVGFLPSAKGAAGPVEDTLEIAAGEFYQETVYPPSDGSLWSVRAEAVNGTGPFDLYIMPSTELISRYPHEPFSPMVVRENLTLAAAEFNAPSRLQAYTLIIDNLDNAASGDAVPQGNLTVMLLRTPPLRSNPEAQAALQAGTTVCAAVLGFAAVGVAIYLRRRPRADLRGELDVNQPRVEIDIAVPPPPRGAWAREAPDDAVVEDPALPPATEAKK